MEGINSEHGGPDEQPEQTAAYSSFESAPGEGDTAEIPLSAGSDRSAVDAQPEPYVEPVEASGDTAEPTADRGTTAHEFKLEGEQLALFDKAWGINYRVTSRILSCIESGGRIPLESRVPVVEGTQAEFDRFAGIEVAPADGVAAAAQLDSHIKRVYMTNEHLIHRTIATKDGELCNMAWGLEMGYKADGRPVYVHLQNLDRLIIRFMGRGDKEMTRVYVKQRQPVGSFVYKKETAGFNTYKRGLGSLPSAKVFADDIEREQDKVALEKELNSIVPQPVEYLGTEEGEFLQGVLAKLSPPHTIHDGPRALRTLKKRLASPLDPEPLDQAWAATELFRCAFTFMHSKRNGTEPIIHNFGNREVTLQAKLGTANGEETTMSARTVAVLSSAQASRFLRRELPPGGAYLYTYDSSLTAEHNKLIMMVSAEIVGPDGQSLYSEFGVHDKADELEVREMNRLFYNPR